MDEREKDIIRTALIYLLANLGDALEAFGEYEDPTPECDFISVNGELISTITEDEIEQCLKLFQ